jgi:glycosyltransferase involved in cell wall biosynthesis
MASFVDGLVSVVIPVYNGERFLARALDSALAQTYRDLEVIVVNDGSTDGSAEVLARYGHRIMVVSQENRGCASARQSGVERSRGEFVAFLDQDDEWASNKIERQVDALTRYPSAVAVYCDHHGIDDEGKRGGPSAGLHPVYSGLIFELLIRSNCIVSASLVMVRRGALDAAGGFDLSQPHWADDWDLWIRLAERGPFLYLLEDLVGYRRHASNTSSPRSFQMSAGNLHTLLHIQPLIRGKPPRVVRAYQEALFGARVAMGWQHRMRGERLPAMRHYFDAWRTRPTATRLLAHIVGIALVPKRFLRKEAVPENPGPKGRRGC